MLNGMKEQNYYYVYGIQNIIRLTMFLCNLTWECGCLCVCALGKSVLLEPIKSCNLSKVAMWISLDETYSYNGQR